MMAIAGVMLRARLVASDGAISAAESDWTIRQVAARLVNGVAISVPLTVLAADKALVTKAKNALPSTRVQAVREGSNTSNTHASAAKPVVGGAENVEIVRHETWRNNQLVTQQVRAVQQHGCTGEHIRVDSAGYLDAGSRLVIPRHQMKDFKMIWDKVMVPGVVRVLRQ